MPLSRHGCKGGKIIPSRSNNTSELRSVADGKDEGSKMIGHAGSIREEGLSSEFSELNAILLQHFSFIFSHYFAI